MAARNLAVGSVPKLVAVLALPIFATFVLQSLYALADLYFVGRIGAPALAGVGITLNTFFLILAVGQSVGTGGLALISQTFGRGDHARVPHLFQQVFWLSAVIGVLFWIGGFLVAEPFIATFTQDADVLREGTAFFRAYCGSFFTQVMLIALSFSFRAVGDFIVPTIMMAISVVLNVALDPPLIFGFGPIPALGVAGAGLATFISQLVGLAGYLWLVFGSRRSALVVVRRPFRVDFAVMWQMLRIGLPAGAQFILFTASMLIAYRYARPFGGDATAAIGLGSRILQCALFPGVAIGAAVSSLAGQNYGAGLYSRVRAAMAWGWLYITILFTVEYALILVQPHFWVSVFAKEPSLVDLGADYLLISGLILPFNAMSLIGTFTAQGLGRTVAPLIGVFVRFTVGVLALVGVDLWIGMTIHRLFWTSIVAFASEFLLFSLILVYLWKSVLRYADGELPPDLAARKAAAGPLRAAPVTE